MSDWIKTWFKACYVIDIKSIRGCDYEITLLQIQDEIKEISNSEYSNASKDFKIALAMVVKIQNLLSKVDIILYSKSQRKLLEDLKEKLDKNPQFPNVQTICGEQTLFYYLGKTNSNISCLKLITNNRSFLSKNFTKFVESFEDNKKLELVHFNKSSKCKSSSMEYPAIFQIFKI